MRSDTAGCLILKRGEPSARPMGALANCRYQWPDICPRHTRLMTLRSPDACRGSTAWICGIDSVNVSRVHAGFRQRQRRLFQRSWQGLAATGRSLGRVVTHEWGLIENIPQPGQRRAASSTVTRASIGLSRSSSSTRVTATPASPRSRVVSLSKPVAFAWTSSLSNLNHHRRSPAGGSKDRVQRSRASATL